LQYIPAHHQHLYVDDTIQCVFRLESKGTEVVNEGYIESEDEDNEVLDTQGIQSKDTISFPIMMISAS
jgi:hypothetical protein